MRISIFYILIILSIQSYSQPVLVDIDISGRYTNNNQDQVISYVSQGSRFNLVHSTELFYSVKLLRLEEKITVKNVITYFIAIEMSEVNVSKLIHKSKNELIVIENSDNGKIWLEIDGVGSWESVIEEGNKTLSMAQ